MARTGANGAVSSGNGGNGSPTNGTTRRAQVTAELEACLRKAREQGRDDLVARLEEARQNLAHRDLPVVVAGEFKQGKSSLVNALVKSEICPVDDDVVTAVPTIVRYGPRPEALVHMVPDPGANGTSGEPPPGPLDDESDDVDGLPPVPIPLDQVVGYVRGDTVPGPPAPPGRVRSVEVRLDRRVLRSGLSFVDCPGVGGLESAEGSITLGVLNLAEAMVFVTDAAQELTRAEVTFIRAALQRCPQVLVVVTKIDLYPEWRRIVALDEAHLAEEGLDVPVIAVSSFLRLRAATTRNPALNEESRYPLLFDYLRQHVVEPGGTGRVEQAANEVVFASRLLRRSLQAESDVLARPQEGQQVVQRLSQAAATTNALRGSSARWQRVLSDGIQDLVEDVKHDLRDRLRTVLQTGEQVIDRSDPKDSWAEFETWIRRQVVTAAAATYDYLARRAVDLAEQVGQQFTRDADTPIALSISAPIAALERIQIDVDFSARSGGKGNVVLTAARGSYGGMLMFGMAGSLLGLSVAAPVALLLSLGLGRKALKDELARRHSVRQQQAKAALRQYVDKVSFVVDKECRDALRRTQRLLRDEFTARAQSLHQSSAQALAQAERALQLDPAELARRRQIVERQLADLGTQDSRAVVAGSVA